MSIFRAYDIRGIVDETLTEDMVYDIGRAVGTRSLEAGCPQVAVARDGRLSGPRLLARLSAGLQAVGCEVLNLGCVPTPVLYFATYHLGTGSGVMLTGSHNPPDYNGLKIMINGQTLSGERIQDLRELIEQDEFSESQAGQERSLDVRNDYIARITDDVRPERGFKVVVDCGNGVAGELAPRLLTALGCEVDPLFCEIDGHFPNHHPDPSQPKNLQDLIVRIAETGADFGIAFDGDGDRLGVVDSQGQVIWPDRQMILFAQDIIQRHPGAEILYDVKCSRNLTQAISEAGGTPVMWKTGHSFMKSKLASSNALLAGEMSGHIFFKERWYGFDDALYSAARLLEILAADNRSPQKLFDELPDAVSTPELQAWMEEGEHFAFMEKFLAQAKFPEAKIARIDGLRADFKQGWGLVRPSNTTPCLVIRFEAESEQTLAQIQTDFRCQMLAINPDLNLPF